MRGNRALVPALWHLEMGNALAVAERRKILRAGEVDRALLDIEQLLNLAIDTDPALWISSTSACDRSLLSFFGLRRQLPEPGS
jgi:hypothetical protein